MSHDPGALLRIAIMNDYEIVVRGLEHALRSSGAEFVFVRPSELATADVVLFDPFGATDGWDRVAELLDARARVVLFSWQEPSARYLDFVEDGILGFIAKSSTTDDLVNALHRIAAGHTVHPRVQPEAPREAAAETQVLGHWPGQEMGLTGRESEILALIAQGLSNTEVAAEMYLSINTIKTHVRLAYRKIGVETRAQAILWCIDHGLRSPAPSDSVR